MNSNPNLSRTVQVSQCDIDFWTQQLTEHTFFLHRLLNAEVVPWLKEEAKIHYKTWYNVLNQKPVRYNAIASNSLYAFLETIHNKIKDQTQKVTGIPINLELNIGDFHALVRHMIFEQTYFTRLVEGNMTIKEELLFWSQENAEHTELLSHLLPPGDFKNAATDLANSLKQTSLIANSDPIYFAQELELIKRSNETAAILHGKVHSGQIRTINDAMLEHEMREAQKGEQRVQYLLTLI